jgi:mannose-6-phosphate isomerase-like protein (cupin superfamily)
MLHCGAMAWESERGMTADLKNTRQAPAGFGWPGLTHPAGEPLRLNRGDFVAVDRDANAAFDAIYRPQALYNVATNGLRANNDSFLLQEVATNLPIHRQDTGPTDFHMHLPPGGFQFVLVTSGMFTFDYDGRIHYVGPGAVIMQSAIVHRQLFYTWSGLSTEENLKTPQTAVPDALSMGYSGKFLEAFITEPATFPNPTVVPADRIVEADTSRTAWAHPVHDRPIDAGFWYQDPLALGALYRPLVDDLPGGPVKSPSPVLVRDLEIESPSGHLAVGHIIATDPTGQSLLPKSSTGRASAADLAKGEVAVYRVIRGTAAFKDRAGKLLELTTGDTVTAGGQAIDLVGMGENTQLLRLGLLKGIDNLRKWTPTQRDEIDGLAGQIITVQALRPARTEGPPVGYLYE